MCICFFCISKNTSDYFKFILVFNREEFSNRETSPLSSFDEDNNIIGGRDLKEKGTWLGFNKQTGNIAFLTNYSDWRVVFSRQNSKNIVSRGRLLYDFLKTDFYLKANENPEVPIALASAQQNTAIKAYAQNVVEKLQFFKPFNLVVGNVQTGQFYYVGNFPKSQSYFALEPGYYSMCNLKQFGKERTKKEDYGLQVFTKLKEECEGNLLSSRSNILVGAANGFVSGMKNKILDLMINRTKFDRGLYTEGSIFFTTYFNLVFWKHRQTKSTTLLTVDKEMRIDILERTYSGDLDSNSQKPLFSEKFMDFNFV